jgi:WD repeat-containing protein 1 (actin-interacting protein 1)
VATNSDSMEVAVGGDDSKVHIYKLTGTTMELKQELEHLGAVTNCAYSPDMKYLVACDVNRKVILYGLPDYKVSSIL